MVEVTDQDIKEALRLDGWAMTRPYEVAIIKAQASTYRQILAHAKTLAKLRVAVDMIESQHAWIDAVPDDVAAQLPAMPGFDRDAFDEALTHLKEPTHD